MENYDLLEYQYTESLRKLLRFGILTGNRTGVDTLALQHQYFFIPDASRNFPLLKGKEVNPNLALIELMWMMNGRTDTKWLHDRGVRYWKEWTGEDGTIGPSYGVQMRNFNGKDNLLNVIEGLINNPGGRRHILSLWNPSDLEKMVLPPCVYQFHFCAVPKYYGTKTSFYLDLHVEARSEDSFLGLPYDFCFSAWFLNIIAFWVNHISKINHKNLLIESIEVPLNFEPRSIHYTAHDFHMYVNHKEQSLEYLHNVDENKNGIIERVVKFIEPDEILHEEISSFDHFLKFSDEQGFSNIRVNKFYQDVYGKIKADIAI